MPSLNSTVINFLSTITLLGQILASGLIIILILNKTDPKNKVIKKVFNIISENYISFILIISAIATIGSLTLSEILNFSPCKLCWYQRIFMYPIAVISFIALIFNESRIKKYILSLSIIGLLIAGYHILLQFLPNIFECSDEVAKCSAVQFASYGYITIPVMAFTAFLLIILVSLFGREK